MRLTEGFSVHLPMPGNALPRGRTWPPGRSQRGKHALYACGMSLGAWLEEQLFERRVVLVTGRLDDDAAAKAAAALLALDARGDRPIELHLAWIIRRAVERCSALAGASPAWGNCRFVPVATEAARRVTNLLKPSGHRPTMGGSTSRRAATRVKPEQASKGKL